MIVLLSVKIDLGLGTVMDALVFMVGSLDTESMTNTFFTVAKTGGLTFLA
jgi:hypothetical protein